MNRNDLERLSKDELIEMVLRLQRPDKTSHNSSKPPSTDRKAMRDLFGLSISEGALMNIFKRTKAAFEAQRTQALTALRQARFVACDETGARIEGDNAYHWVFCCKQAVVHAAAFSRGAQVVRD